MMNSIMCTLIVPVQLSSLWLTTFEVGLNYEASSNFRVGSTSKSTQVKIHSQNKKVSNHHASLSLEMYSFTL